MRDQLRDLEGQLIFIEGKVTSYSNRNGKIYVCLRRPVVIPWDGDAPLGDVEKDGKKVVGIDHLWVETSGHDEIHMLTDVLSCSRVRWYSRKDGSVDLGTEPLHVLHFHDREIKDVVAARKLGKFGKNHGDSSLQQQLEFCDYYLELLRTQGEFDKDLGKPRWVFSNAYSITWLIDFYEDYERELHDARAHFERAQQKVELQVKRGRCRSAGRFSDLLR